MYANEPVVTMTRSQIEQTFDAMRRDAALTPPDNRMPAHLVNPAEQADQFISLARQLKGV